MSYAQNGRVRVWFEEQGEGLPLVLLQGLSLSSRFWLDAPRRLEGRFRVILVDNRGTGRTDCPKGLYTIRGMAGDALAVVAELGLERYAVAGISMGGMIAQEVALATPPERLSGLALMNTTCGLPKGRLPWFGSFWKLARLVRRTPENLAIARKMLVAPRALEKNPSLFREFDRLLAEQPVPPAIFAKQLLACCFHSSGRRLGRLRCPVLVAVGKEDHLVPPTNSRILAKLMPGAKLVEHPEVGHCFPLESKNLFDKTFDLFWEMMQVGSEAAA